MKAGSKADKLCANGREYHKRSLFSSASIVESNPPSRLSNQLFKATSTNSLRSTLIFRREFACNQ